MTLPSFGVKKIARVSTVPFFIVTQLKCQVECMRDSGMQVVLVCSSGPELEQMTFSQGLSFEAVEIQRKIRPWLDILALVHLYRLFRCGKFEIVHSTTPKAGMLSAIAAFLARVPVRLHTFTGQPWVTMRGLQRWLSFAGDWLVGLLNTRCYADSQSQKNFLIDSGVVSEKNIFVLGKGSLAGVDLERFSRTRWSVEENRLLRKQFSIADDAFVLLFVGRITKDKGVCELFNAYERQRASGRKVVLVLVGPVEDSSGQELLLRCEEDEQVHYVGYSDCPERYMAIADLLCLPSYREGFGTVVMEAAAMGIPTVGSEITGLNDAIEDGVTGLLVPPRDEYALSLALSKLIDDRELLNCLGENALERCHRDFSADTVNQLVVSEYFSIAASG